MKLKVTIDNKVYEVEIEDIQARPVIALVEGQRFEVWPESAASQKSSSPAPTISIPDSSLAENPFNKVGQETRSTEVTSPLPGVIVTILVKPGDTVSHGDELCTLEAMKMKNAIRANREGIIETVTVQVGDQVSHGQLLLTYQP